MKTNRTNFIVAYMISKLTQSVDVKGIIVLYTGIKTHTAFKNV